MTKQEWIKIYNAKDGTWDKDDLIDKAYEIITSPIKTNLKNMFCNAKIEPIGEIHFKTEKDIKSEAIKEFAERVYSFFCNTQNWKTFKEQWLENGECYWLKEKLNNLVKEMTEGL